MTPILIDKDLLTDILAENTDASKRDAEHLVNVTLARQTKFPLDETKDDQTVINLTRIAEGVETVIRLMQYLPKTRDGVDEEMITLVLANTLQIIKQVKKFNFASPCRNPNFNLSSEELLGIYRNAAKVADDALENYFRNVSAFGP